MIRPRALRDTITIYSTTYAQGSGDAARYGDDVPTEADGVTVAAQVTPTTGRGGEREMLAGQDRRVSLVRVIIGPDVEVTGLDRVEWDGRSWDVFGEPETFHTRSGSHHQVLNLRSVGGA